MSAIFEAKPVPSDEKLRGGYYTPDVMAEFLAQWVSEAGARLLEPSCGDGQILKYLAQLGDAVGIELLEAEAQKASRASSARVIQGDFFAWFKSQSLGSFDGVAGNPPYIRFGSWQESQREKAFALMREAGLNPSRLTNAWLPFVVASLLATRHGGRIGLVLPAELLQVGYAAELRGYLVDTCSEITVVSFRELVFPGILQEVVLLLATKGHGPARFSTVELLNADELVGLKHQKAEIRAPLHSTEKWTKYFLNATEVEKMRELISDERLQPLRKFARVNVGVVTGRNSFFCMTEAQASQLGVLSHTIPLLSRSAQFTGVNLTREDLREQANRGAVTRLLAASAEAELSNDENLAEYIFLGEREGVQNGYKCRIRNPWWVVPSTTKPSGFMLRQVSSYLRLINNDADATSTDTVHRVFCAKGIDMRKLAVAALNSATVACSEVLGRSYGGGLLEVEPSEAGNLPIPNPDLISKGLVNRVDKFLRDGQVRSAIRLVDQEVLIGRLGFTEQEMKIIESAGQRLLQRRLSRSKPPSSTK